MQLLEKVRKIKSELEAYFIERQEEIELLLTAIVAKQHVLFLGPPGTAKGFLIRAVASHIDGCKYFERLLTKFSTPEELFGPYDLNKLKEGKYERIISGKLPEAHIAFIDEVFKASSAILNTLLTIMADRIFYNDGKPMKVPLISLISASNELPEEDEPLQALYDRFLIRKTVDYVKDYGNLETLLGLPDEYVPSTKISLKDVEALQKMAASVDISEVKKPIIAIKRNLMNNGIVVSDRRLKWSVSVVRATAALNGRNKATIQDLWILQHVFWDDPQQIPTVKGIVYDVVNPYAKKAVELSGILDDIERDLTKLAAIENKTTQDTQRLIDIFQQISKIGSMVKNEIKNARRDGLPTDDLEKVGERVKRLAELAKDALGFGGF